MTWPDTLRNLFRTGLPHIKKSNNTGEKNNRIATLSAEEMDAYKWLFEGYSEEWTAETLGLERRTARTLFKSIYRKLGVRNMREIIRYYVPRDI
jgi:DNA-binding CsgD family transcriptional regulator